MSAMSAMSLSFDNSQIMLSRLVIVASAALGLVAGQEITSIDGDMRIRTSRQVGVRLRLSVSPPLH